VNAPPTPDIAAGSEVAPASKAQHAERVSTGMFGVSGTGDTSGFGGLVRRFVPVKSSPRPFGGYFDELVDALTTALAEVGAVADAIMRVVVDRCELTLHIRPDVLLTVAGQLRDSPALRFELCSSVSGVDYFDPDAPQEIAPQRLHAVYHLMSMTYRRRLRLEVAVDAQHPRVPSVTSVYPTADWQEREAYDMFGIVFDGHPALTRILMPDDWDGHPQRKDYPLGGVPVEYKGAQIPPPDNRRAYR